jgi:hypothetical protein
MSLQRPPAKSPASTFLRQYLRSQARLSATCLMRLVWNLPIYANAHLPALACNRHPVKSR